MEYKIMKEVHPTAIYFLIHMILWTRIRISKKKTGFSVVVVFVVAVFLLQVLTCSHDSTIVSFSVYSE